MWWAIRPVHTLLYPTLCEFGWFFEVFLAQLTIFFEDYVRFSVGFTRIQRNLTQKLKKFAKRSTKAHIFPHFPTVGFECSLPTSTQQHHSIKTLPRLEAKTESKKY